MVRNRNLLRRKCVTISRRGSKPVSLGPLDAVRPASEDIDARVPTWDALSSLFLDTDISLLRGWRAQRLASSPYSVEELETILRDEVFPVCSWNLLSVAGEWAGFDQEWLRDAILRRLRRRFKIRVGFGHRLITRSTEWRRTREMLVALRSGGGI